MSAAVLAYLDKAIATFDGDPPANDYQRGHLEALKVARAELATILAAERVAPRGPLLELRRYVNELLPGTENRNDLERIYELLETPIPMILHCPKCGEQHVDVADPENGWHNPPHRSHLCPGCGTIWRPADVATTGVAMIETGSSADTWRPPLLLTEEVDPQCEGCELPMSVCDCEEVGRQ